MSSINPVLAAAAAALAAACTSPAGPDHTENNGSQATAIPAIAHTTGEKPDPPAGEASQPASVPAHRAIEASAGAGARAAPYLATLKSPVAVISLRSAGRLDVSGGCIVAALRGERYTAVFPPADRLIGTAAAYSAVSYGGRSLPLGRDTTLPGGGADITAANLAKPPPPACPKNFFVIGG